MSHTHAHATAGSDTVVSVSKVCVEFDGTHVLENVDLDIPRGSVVALLGPNGSGKSTLVRVILGLQPITHGRVTLFGTPLARFRDWQRIALVPQRLPATGNVPVSVWEMVLAGMMSPRLRWRRLGAERKAAARTALETVGLYERRHERIDALSGGQQRRAMIARALANNPDLLVLDEPTAGLDAENITALTQTLELLHTQGKTLCIVTHEVDDLGPLITRAIVLGNGTHTSVRFDGPPPIPHALHDHVHHHEDAPHDDTAHGLGLEA